MKIIHSSDWHLGKSLEGNLRIDEQKEFFEELNEICESENVDLIIIPGDIYDNFSPSSIAQKLFYDEIKKLSKDGKRPVIIVSGNHDSAERLTASNSYLSENAVFVFGNFNDTVEEKSYGEFKVLRSEKGYLEAEYKNETLSIILLPYPSEKRLDEILYLDSSNEEMQNNYSKKIGLILEKLSKNFRKDTVNLILSHLYTRGGIESSSERRIQLGGSLAVDLDDVPKADYVALGHLHRAQRIGVGKRNIYYSGSPIQYSKSEINYSKSVFIYDSKEKTVEEKMLKNYKPIEIWKVKGAKEAIKMCEEKKDNNSWVYLEIETDELISTEEIKEMRKNKKDIIEIKPLFNEQNEEEDNVEFEEDIKELFEKFYLENRKVEPAEEIMDLFLSLVNIEGVEE